MKILITADSAGGVWTYALELSRGLAAAGHHVALAVVGRPRPDQVDEALAIPGISFHGREAKLEWMPDPWEDLALTGQWLLRLEDRIAPDVVHLNSFVHGVLPWTAPLLVTGHSCVVSWWRAVERSPLPPEWNEYRRRVAAGLRAADAVTAPTRALLVELDEDHGPFRKASVVANGLDPSLFAAGEKRDVIFAAGRVWDGGKNLRALAKAASSVPWPVEIAGEGGLAGLDEGGRDVQLLGWQSAAEVRRRMAEAAIFALPARYEPFGLSALEAALSGCALVLGDIPSLREVWGEAALFVPPDDDEALAAALQRLCDDSALRREYAERAWRHGRRYSAQRMVEQYLEIYRKLHAAAPTGIVERAAKRSEHVGKETAVS